MGFYNAFTPKVDINQFVFDAIFNSVDTMTVQGGSIFPGRYVLIRMDDDSIQKNSEAYIENHATVWRKENDGSFIKIAQLEPSAMTKAWLNSEDGMAYLEKALPEAISAALVKIESGEVLEGTFGGMGKVPRLTLSVVEDDSGLKYNAVTKIEEVDIFDPSKPLILRGTLT